MGSSEDDIGRPSRARKRPLRFLEESEQEFLSSVPIPRPRRTSAGISTGTAVTADVSDDEEPIKRRKGETKGVRNSSTSSSPLVPSGSPRNVSAVCGKGSHSEAESPVRRRGRPPASSLCTTQSKHDTDNDRAQGYPISPRRRGRPRLDHMSASPSSETQKDDSVKGLLPGIQPVSVSDKQPPATAGQTQSDNLSQGGSTPSISQAPKQLPTSSSTSTSQSSSSKSGRCVFCSKIMKKPWDVVNHMVQEHQIRLCKLSTGDGFPIDTDPTCIFCGGVYASTHDVLFHITLFHTKRAFGREAMSDFCSVEMQTPEGKTIKLKVRLRRSESRSGDASGNRIVAPPPVVQKRSEEDQ